MSLALAFPPSVRAERPAPVAAPHLRVDDVSLAFGGVQALAGVSFAVSVGEIAAIIGPNGAGKSSLLNAISGVYAPQRGEIQFEGAQILGAKPHQIARLGIARTFQNLGLFAKLSVLDNLLLGRHLHMRSGLLRGGVYWGPARREEARQREVVAAMVEMFKLQPVLEVAVGSLPYGTQKRVELARALAQAPRLLLLDEPMAGMNQREKEAMTHAIVDLQAASGVTVVMIEHDMGVIMEIASHIIVLDFGRIIADASAEEVQHDPAVIRAYLGTDDMQQARSNGERSN